MHMLLVSRDWSGWKPVFHRAKLQSVTTRIWICKSLVSHLLLGVSYLWCNLLAFEGGGIWHKMFFKLRLCLKFGTSTITALWKAIALSVCVVCSKLVVLHSPVSCDTLQVVCV